MRKQMTFFATIISTFVLLCFCSPASVIPDNGNGKTVTPDPIPSDTTAKDPVDTTHTPVVRDGAITLSPLKLLRRFDGLGALESYGKLLYDYDEPYRSQILDYMFLPDFGAGLQILKVEMGCDGNNTAMSWPAHRRTLSESNNFERGFGWWMMKEAKKRNPDIILSALNWGWPAWCTTDDKKSDFVVDYVEGAWNTHGLRIDYIGGNQNESDITPSVTKLIRQKLDQRGFSDVKIICADEGAKKAKYEVLDKLSADPSYAAVVDVIGVHYKSREADFMPAVTYTFGKPLWSTEDGGGGYGSAGQGNAWIKQLMKLFVDVKMSAAIRWLTTASIYDNMPWPGNGIMRTKDPWCGHFQVGANLWAFAHFTQFIKPGWMQMDTSDSYVDKGKLGRYVSYCDITTGDWSMVVDAHETGMAATDVVIYPDGLKTTTVHVWRSQFTSDGEWFVEKESLSADKEGYFTFKAEPGYVYTLSTTTGQKKGHYDSPAKKGFPKPYSDNFDSYSSGQQARYFVDGNAVFEVAEATGRSGKVLRQVITEAPQQWHPGSTHPFQPVTEIGGMEWKDYTVQVDAMMENSGKVVLGGRIDSVTESTADHDMQGYWLTVGSAGKWTLRRRDAGKAVTLREGTLPYGSTPGTWFTMKLVFTGSVIDAYVNEWKLCSVTDATYAKGNVILGTLAASTTELHTYTSSYCTVQFDDFKVE